MEQPEGAASQQSEQHVSKGDFEQAVRNLCLLEKKLRRELLHNLHDLRLFSTQAKVDLVVRRANRLFAVRQQVKSSKTLFRQEREIMREFTVIQGLLSAAAQLDEDEWERTRSDCERLGGKLSEIRRRQRRLSGQVEDLEASLGELTTALDDDDETDVEKLVQEEKEFDRMFPSLSSYPLFNSAPYSSSATAHEPEKVAKVQDLASAVESSCEAAAVQKVETNASHLSKKDDVEECEKVVEVVETLAVRPDHDTSQTGGLNLQQEEHKTPDLVDSSSDRREKLEVTKEKDVKKKTKDRNEPKRKKKKERCSSTDGKKKKETFDSWLAEKEDSLKKEVKNRDELQEEIITTNDARSSLGLLADDQGVDAAMEGELTEDSDADRKARIAEEIRRAEERVFEAVNVTTQEPKLTDELQLDQERVEHETEVLDEAGLPDAGGELEKNAGVSKAKLLQEVKLAQETQVSKDVKPARESLIDEAKQEEVEANLAEEKASEEGRIAAQENLAKEARCVEEEKNAQKDTKLADEALLAEEAHVAEEEQVAPDSLLQKDEVVQEKFAEEARIAQEVGAAEEKRHSTERLSKEAEEEQPEKHAEKIRVAEEVRVAEEKGLVQDTGKGSVSAEKEQLAQERLTEEESIFHERLEEKARLAGEAELAEERLAKETGATTEEQFVQEIFAEETSVAGEDLEKSAGHARAAEEARRTETAEPSEEARAVEEQQFMEEILEEEARLEEEKRSAQKRQAEEIKQAEGGAKLADEVAHEQLSSEADIKKRLEQGNIRVADEARLLEQGCDVEAEADLAQSAEEAKGLEEQASHKVEVGKDGELLSVTPGEDAHEVHREEQQIEVEEVKLPHEKTQERVGKDSELIADVAEGSPIDRDLHLTDVTHPEEALAVKGVSTDEGPAEGPGHDSKVKVDVDQDGENKRDNESFDAGIRGVEESLAEGDVGRKEEKHLKSKQTEDKRVVEDAELEVTEKGTEISDNGRVKGVTTEQKIILDDATGLPELVTEYESAEEPSLHDKRMRAEDLTEGGDFQLPEDDAIDSAVLADHEKLGPVVEDILDGHDFLESGGEFGEKENLVAQEWLCEKDDNYSEKLLPMEEEEENARYAFKQMLDADAWSPENDDLMKDRDHSDEEMLDRETFDQYGYEEMIDTDVWSPENDNFVQRNVLVDEEMLGEEIFDQYGCEEMVDADVWSPENDTLGHEMVPADEEMFDEEMLDEGTFKVRQELGEEGIDQPEASFAEEAAAFNKYGRFEPVEEEIFVQKDMYQCGLSEETWVNDKVQPTEEDIEVCADREILSDDFIQQEYHLQAAHGPGDEYCAAEEMIAETLDQANEQAWQAQRLLNSSANNVPETQPEKDLAQSKSDAREIMDTDQIDAALQSKEILFSELQETTPSDKQAVKGPAIAKDPEVGAEVSPIETEKETLLSSDKTPASKKTKKTLNDMIAGERNVVSDHEEPTQTETEASKQNLLSSQMDESSAPKKPKKTLSDKLAARQDPLSEQQREEDKSKTAFAKKEPNASKAKMQSPQGDKTAALKKPKKSLKDKQAEKEEGGESVDTATVESEADSSKEDLKSQQKDKTTVVPKTPKKTPLQAKEAGQDDRQGGTIEPSTSEGDKEVSMEDPQSSRGHKNSAPKKPKRTLSDKLAGQQAAMRDQEEANAASGTPKSETEASMGSVESSQGGKSAAPKKPKKSLSDKLIGKQEAVPEHEEVSVGASTLQNESSAPKKPKKSLKDMVSKKQDVSDHEEVNAESGTPKSEAEAATGSVEPSQGGKSAAPKKPKKSLSDKLLGKQEAAPEQEEVSVGASTPQNASETSTTLQPQQGDKTSVPKKPKKSLKDMVPEKQDLVCDQEVNVEVRTPKSNINVSKETLQSQGDQSSAPKKPKKSLSDKLVGKQDVVPEHVEVNVEASTPQNESSVPKKPKKTLKDMVTEKQGADHQEVPTEGRTPQSEGNVSKEALHSQGDKSTVGRKPKKTLKDMVAGKQDVGSEHEGSAAGNKTETSKEQLQSPGDEESSVPKRPPKTLKDLVAGQQDVARDHQEVATETPQNEGSASTQALHSQGGKPAALKKPKMTLKDMVAGQQDAVRDQEEANAASGTPKSETEASMGSVESSQGGKSAAPKKPKKSLSDKLIGKQEAAPEQEEVSVGASTLQNESSAPKKPKKSLKDMVSKKQDVSDHQEVTTESPQSEGSASTQALHSQGDKSTVGRKPKKTLKDMVAGKQDPGEEEESIKTAGKKNESEVTKKDLQSLKENKTSALKKPKKSLGEMLVGKHDAESAHLDDDVEVAVASSAAEVRKEGVHSVRMKGTLPKKTKKALEDKPAGQPDVVPHRAEEDASDASVVKKGIDSTKIAPNKPKTTLTERLPDRKGVAKQPIGSDPTAEADRDEPKRRDGKSSSVSVAPPSDAEGTTSGTLPDPAHEAPSIRNAPHASGAASVSEEKFQVPGSTRGLAPSKTKKTMRQGKQPGVQVAQGEEDSTGRQWEESEDSNVSPVAQKGVKGTSLKKQKLKSGPLADHRSTVSSPAAKASELEQDSLAETDEARRKPSQKRLVSNIRVPAANDPGEKSRSPTPMRQKMVVKEQVLEKQTSSKLFKGSGSDNVLDVRDVLLQDDGQSDHSISPTPRKATKSLKGKLVSKQKTSFVQESKESLSEALRCQPTEAETAGSQSVAARQKAPRARQVEEEPVKKRAMATKTKGIKSIGELNLDKAVRLKPSEEAHKRHSFASSASEDSYRETGLQYEDKAKGDEQDHQQSTAIDDLDSADMPVPGRKKKRSLMERLGKDIFSNALNKVGKTITTTSSNITDLKHAFRMRKDEVAEGGEAEQTMQDVDERDIIRTSLDNRISHYDAAAAAAVAAAAAAVVDDGGDVEISSAAFAASPDADEQKSVFAAISDTSLTAGRTKSRSRGRPAQTAVQEPIYATVSKSRDTKEESPPTTLCPMPTLRKRSRDRSKQSRDASPNKPFGVLEEAQLDAAAAAATPPKGNPQVDVNETNKKRNPYDTIDSGISADDYCYSDSTLQRRDSSEDRCEPENAAESDTLRRLKKVSFASKEQKAILRPDPEVIVLPGTNLYTYSPSATREQPPEASSMDSRRRPFVPVGADTTQLGAVRDEEVTERSASPPFKPFVPQNKSLLVKQPPQLLSVASMPAFGSQHHQQQDTSPKAFLNEMTGGFLERSMEALAEQQQQLQDQTGQQVSGVALGTLLLKNLAKPSSRTSSLDRVGRGRRQGRFGGMVRSESSDGAVTLPRQSRSHKTSAGGKSVEWSIGGGGESFVSAKSSLDDQSDTGSSLSKFDFLSLKKKKQKHSKVEETNFDELFERGMKRESQAAVAKAAALAGNVMATGMRNVDLLSKEEVFKMNGKDAGIGYKEKVQSFLFHQPPPQESVLVDESWGLPKISINRNLMAVLQPSLSEPSFGQKKASQGGEYQKMANIYFRDQTQMTPAAGYYPQQQRQQQQQQPPPVHRMEPFQRQPEGQSERSRYQHHQQLARPQPAQEDYWEEHSYHTTQQTPVPNSAVQEKQRKMGHVGDGVAVMRQSRPTEKRQPFRSLQASPIPPPRPQIRIRSRDSSAHKKSSASSADPKEFLDALHQLVRDAEISDDERERGTLFNADAPPLPSGQQPRNPGGSGRNSPQPPRRRSRDLVPPPSPLPLSHVADLHLPRRLCPDPLQQQQERRHFYLDDEEDQTPYRRTTDTKHGEIGWLKQCTSGNGTATSTSGTGSGRRHQVPAPVRQQQQVGFEPSFSILEKKREVIQAIAHDKKAVREAKVWLLCTLLLSVCASIIFYLHMEVE